MRFKSILVQAGASCVFSIMAATLLAPSPSSAQDCMLCHQEGNQRGAPPVRGNEKFAHSELSCTECHQGDEPAQDNALSCKLCHADQVTRLGKSSHGNKLMGMLKEQKGKIALRDICFSCHGQEPHHLLSSRRKESPTNALNVMNTCLACHETIMPHLMDEFGTSVHATAIKNGNTASATCNDCHGSHAIEKPELEESNLNHSNVHETCGNCHQEEKVQYLTSIHSELLLTGDPDVPSCTDCHGNHNIYAPDDVRSQINILQVDKTCIKCHADPEVTKSHPNLPPPEFIEDYEDTVHGRGIHIKGLAVSASCSSCHGWHTIRPEEDPDSTIHRDNVPETCSKCHLGIFDEYAESEHGKMWEQGEGKGPVCTTCHTSHEIQEPTRLLFTTFKITKECEGCHDEKASSYSDTFHGKTTSMGFLVAAKCSDCHTPHHNLPAGDPASSIHPDNLQKTCGRCHGEVNENFVKYDSHPNFHDKEANPLLFWLKRFMDLLIIGVFGFFGVHTLLWLQRSLVAYFRGEPEVNIPHEGDKHVRRWSRTAVIMHIVIVTSFLGLVATGLPLRYHYTEWAKVLGSVYGGVEVARYIHRFCAAVTIGYAVFHLGFLFTAIVVKKRFELLYGPDTLVPRRKDFQDLYQNFKYFLYMGPAPRFGKWTYFEKFDYFALFWGVPIVAITGLIMIFPAFFSNFLPGNVLNAASLVHSEEALLAAGFIFVFHFFHNHMRPGVVPMDVNIFTGTMPLERLMAERPEEYERIQREGLMDELVVDAPEKRVMWESKLFGFIALSVGLFLIIAIFISYVMG